MAYTKQTWVNNETLVDEDRMNHIENGIYQNAEDISEINQSLSDIDIVTQRGSSIPANSDLNDYTAYGKYYSSGGTVSATLDNCPTSVQGSGFSLYVIAQGSNSAYIFQLIVRTGNAVNPMIYYREFISAWGNWYGITASVQN